MKSSLLLTTLVFALGLTLMIDQDRWLAPEEAKEIKNTVEYSDKSAKTGQKIFSQRCVVCHGKEGEGDGPGGKALKPQPANLRSKLVQDQTDGEIFWKITNGRGPMIKWGPIIKEEDRWHLVNYIRSLSEK